MKEKPLDKKCWIEYAATAGDTLMFINGVISGGLIVSNNQIDDFIVISSWTALGISSLLFFMSAVQGLDRLLKCENVYQEK